MELKPCPFCGGKVSYQYDGAFEISGIRCSQCKSLTKFYRIPVPKKTDTFGKTMDLWAREWNRRPGDAQGSDRG